MTAADTYRQYAAECVSLSQHRDDASEKALLIEMATMWLRLAELAEKNERSGESPLDL